MLMDRRSIIGRLAAATDLEDESVPGLPIIEIAGNRRVLIEYHKGICQYTAQAVCVKVTFGCIHVLGENLEIGRMTRNQLVVTGCIHQIELDGGHKR